jgi:hypothetical protein
VNVGDYLENLSLDTGYGFIEKLSIKLKVLAPAPDWSIDTDEFGSTMNIVGRIKIDDIISEDTYDKIAAFSDNEVRGVGHLIYDANAHEYIMYLTVYDGKKDEVVIQRENVTPKEVNLKFKIWDSSQGKVLEASFNEVNEPSKATVTFQLDAIKGSIITQNVEQIVPLNAGWTWVSFNVRDQNFTNVKELMKNLDLTTGDRIISSKPARFAKYDIYTDEWVWSGVEEEGPTGAESKQYTEEELYIEKAYKINMSKSQNLTVKGSRVNFNNFEKTINKGWNWISYPVETTKTVNEALGNYEASVGDVIKSQNSFSEYHPSEGWRGNLDYLEPGKGYSLYSKADEDKLLIYPAYFAASKSKNNKAMQQEQIATTFTKYSSNMNAIVSLPEGYSKLYAYDNEGVLKGSAKGQLIDGEMLSFITLYGDNTENLTFHIGNDSKEIKTSKVIDFVGNKVLGTVSDPVILELGELDAVHVFPNPFSDTLTVSVTVSSDQKVELNLYSILNQKVITKKFNAKQGKNVFDLKTSRIPSGVYLLKISKNENSIAYKVIKK